MSHSLPTIAIHGVGRHEPGVIEKRVGDTVGRDGGFDLTVAEFNWDQSLDHGVVADPQEAFENLQRVCVSLHGTAAAAILVRRNGVDTHLSQLQLACCGLLRRIVAVSVAALFGIPAVALVVLLPAALGRIGPFWPAEQVRWVLHVVVPVVLVAVVALVAAVLVLGAVRAVVGLSFAPVRSALTAVVLLALSPLLALVGIPLSVAWTVVGSMVAFFALFGVVASVIEWLAPDAPVTSIWKDFHVARYLLGVLAALAALQALRFLLGRVWHEGPVKVLLDITRYVGQPDYRSDRLTDLDAFVRERAGDAADLVVVAHSLGTVIALDYLCNWENGDDRRGVTLVTMGSPFRRFFQRWLPGVLFDRRTARTAGRIRGRYRTFRWVNIYRPLDYIGTSLRLADDGVGVDRSTGELRRLNGHADYWGDDCVLATIRAALRSLPPPPAAPPTASGAAAAAPDVTPAAHAEPDATHAASRGGPRAGRSAPDFHGSDGVHLVPAFVKLGAVLACLSLGWMAYAFADQRAELAITRATIDERGVRTEVLVAHREIPDVAGELSTADEFRFVGLDLPPYQVAPSLPMSVAQQRLDRRALKDFVRSDCTLPKHGKSAAGEQLEYCTSLRPVMIAYLPSGGPGDFYLPDFRSHFRFGDLPGWVLYPIIFMAITFIPSAPFVWLTAATYAAFLGRELDDTFLDF